MDSKKDRIDPGEDGAPSKYFTLEMYQQLAKEFLKLLEINPEKKDVPISIKATADSIIITLYNLNRQPVFEKGTTQLTQWGEYACQNLSWIVDRFHMKMRVDAHISQGTLPLTEKIDIWDFTTEQANTVRRRMVFYGLDSQKIDRVSGFGDTHPLKGALITDPDNYRIELSLMATQDTPRPKAK